MSAVRFKKYIYIRSPVRYDCCLGIIGIFCVSVSAEKCIPFVANHIMLSVAYSSITHELGRFTPGGSQHVVSLRVHWATTRIIAAEII